MFFPSVASLPRRPVLAALCALALASCAGLPPAGKTTAITIDRAAALASVNAFRAEHGLGALAVDERLMRTAATQSAAMAARDSMDHAVIGRLDGRIEAEGYRWSTIAENIGKIYATYPRAMAGWIASPHHRANLLNPAMTEIGFAGAHAEGGRNYWTQVFAAPSAQQR
jgi:uncharacterized protein YkwD